MNSRYIKPLIIIGSSLLIPAAIVIVLTMIFSAGTPSKQVLAAVQQSGAGVPGVENVSATYSPDSACENLCKKYSARVTINDTLTEQDAIRVFNTIATANVKVTKPLSLCFLYEHRSLNMDKDLEEAHVGRLFTAIDPTLDPKTQCGTFLYDKEQGKFVALARNTVRDEQRDCERHRTCTAEDSLADFPWVSSATITPLSGEYAVRVSTQNNSLTSSQLKSILTTLRDDITSARSPSFYIVVRKADTPRERLNLVEAAAPFNFTETTENGTVLKVTSFNLSFNTSLR